MRSLKYFFITFCVSLVVFGLIAWILCGNFIGGGEKKINKPVINTSKNSQVQLVEDEDDAVTGEKFTAVLCCYDDTVGRADSIVLVNVDKGAEKFSVCSIPSYLKINIGTEKVKKEVYLGDLLSEKGKSYFVGKIEAVTGLTVDYHAFISSKQFVKIIDKLGGIEFNVPMNMHYVNSDGVELINLKAGQAKLSGEQALDLVSFRSYPGVASNDDGDSLRRKTQCDFLYKVFETFLKKDNKEKLEGIVVNALELVSEGNTNFTVAALIKHMDMILSFSDYSHEIVEYPIITSKIEVLPNGENLAVHTPDLNKAIEDVFSQFRKS